MLVNETNADIITEPLDHTKVNSTVLIKQMLEENRGKYECVAISKGEIKREFFNIALKGTVTLY